MGTPSSKPKTRKKRSGSEPFEPPKNNASPTDESAVRHTLPRYSLADVPNARLKPSVGSNQMVQNTPENTRLADMRVVLSKLCAVKPKYNVLQDMDWSMLDSRTQYLLFEAACELLDQDKALMELEKQNCELNQRLKNREEIKKLSPVPAAILARKALGNTPGHIRSASHDFTSELRFQKRLSASTLAVDNSNYEEFSDRESTAGTKMRTDMLEKVVFLYSRLEIVAMNFKHLLDQAFKTDASRATALTTCIHEAIELATEAYNSTILDVTKRLMNPFDNWSKSAEKSALSSPEMQPRKSAILEQIQKLEESIQQKALTPVNMIETARKEKSAEWLVKDYLLNESNSVAATSTQFYNVLVSQLQMKWRKRFELTAGYDAQKEFCEAASQFAWRAVCLDEVQLDCSQSTFLDTLHNTYRCTKKEGASVDFYVWPILRRKESGTVLYKGRVKLL